ncbi:MAG TPA: isocitrate lyase/phosphoenolpyruvate mutase family protein [Terriglobia bacterium]|nr:isocitrate lyase/phosphoenolpyruvate mutase family protein [Terriglobia bacterium]
MDPSRQAAQAAQAAAFRQLHQGPHILVLPNAWDPGSARVFEALGFPAVATTSAGVANALGYPDGEHLPFDDLLTVVRWITRTVRIPVTADIEAGFGETADEVVGAVKRVIAAGAVGINLEDSTGPADNPLAEVSVQVEKIKAVRAVAESVDVPLVINARTDVYLAGVGDPASRLPHAIQRLNAYRAAGADCLFAPGVSDTKTIGALAREVHGPLNILAVRGTPSAPELERLGVRRVSVGSGPARAALTLVRRIGQELLSTGTYTSFTEGSMTYAEANQLFQYD